MIRFFPVSRENRDFTVLATAMDAMFLKTTKQHPKTTIYMHIVAFCLIYTYSLWLNNKKEAVFCIYGPFLNSYIVSPVIQKLLGGPSEQLPMFYQVFSVAT